MSSYTNRKSRIGQWKGIPLDTKAATWFVAYYFKQISHKRCPGKTVDGLSHDAWWNSCVLFLWVSPSE